MNILHSLKVFMTVVEEASFARAADRLDLSRAVISKHVKGLEEELGTRLLERTTRRLAITEAGKAFYERAQRAVAELDEAMLEAGQATAAPRGKIRVTCALSFGVRHFSPAVSAFLERYPQVTIDLDLSDRFVDIGEEGFDLAIRIGALGASSLVARKIAVTKMVVCGAPGYLKRHAPPASPAQLAQHNCLVYSYSPQPKLWTFRRHGEDESVEIQGRVRANNGDFLRQLAVDGRGLALLPAFILGEDLLGGRLMPVLGDYDAGELGIYAVYTSRKFMPVKVRALLDFLVERFSGVAPWEQWSAAATSRRRLKKAAGTPAGSVRR